MHKVTIRNWVPCHGSRLSPQRSMFDPWAVDAESVADTVAAVAYPGILFGGVQQIQLRTEDRENGDLGAVAP